ncbi:MAG TPA: L-histidine N(alpha)-methyltransferase [Planctomycetota bacterium]
MRRRLRQPTPPLRDLMPGGDRFRADVLAGLARAPKSLPPKYFYDAEGSRLFDAICMLPEYYLTRTEYALMQERAGEMARRLGPRVMLVEPGSGSSVKSRLLLDALEDPVAYVPVDISQEHLASSAAGVDRAYPELAVLPVAADFAEALALPAPPRPARRAVVYFPGSTLGNFDPPAARALLRRFRALAGVGGALLIGVDLCRDPAVLQPAYDDPGGVTAAFNRNLLARINRELGADFEPLAFDHRAAWNEAAGCVEIHLVSRRDQIVRVAGRRFAFRRGEALHTENSYKYEAATFEPEVAAAGFAPLRRWTDPLGRFGVFLFDTA